MRIALLYGDMEWLAGGLGQLRYSASDYGCRQGLQRNTVHADLRRLAAIGAIRLYCDQANSASIDLLGLIASVQEAATLAAQGCNPCPPEQQALLPGAPHGVGTSFATPKPGPSDGHPSEQQGHGKRPARPRRRATPLAGAAHPEMGSRWHPPAQANGRPEGKRRLFPADQPSGQWLHPSPPRRKAGDRGSGVGGWKLAASVLGCRVDDSGAKKSF
ncbi:MAG: hypothetical protein RLZZ609_2950 [Cyanobacteriota bacterium]|jgi:hypothetical protein